MNLFDSVFEKNNKFATIQKQEINPKQSLDKISTLPNII